MGGSRELNRREFLSAGLGAGTAIFLLGASKEFGVLNANHQPLNPEVLTYKTVGNIKLKVHVWKPAGWNPHQKRSAIVFYHGGGWRRGSWDSFERQARYFASRGLVTLSVGYRTQGPVLATVDGVDAMNFVFRHVSELGIDRDRIVAAGGSAGGEIALATIRTELPHSDPVNKPSAIILFNPVTDTTGEYPSGYGRGQFANDQQAWKYSPFDHISRGDPPALIMQGTGDTTVSFWNSARFVTKMLDSGNRAVLITYDGATWVL